jgi:HSP20 family molecular chaperone IbpA
MGNLARYTSADLPQLMERITKNSIGLDNFFDTFFDQDVTTNYPPYNLIHVNNVESRLEIALAGFKKKEVKVYTEYGKLYVTANKEDKESSTEYVHKGLAQRSFERAWTLSEDVEIKDVTFEDGLLTATLGKIVPDHHARKEYL